MRESSPRRTCEQRAPPVGGSLLQAYLSHCPCIRAARKHQAGRQQEQLPRLQASLRCPRVFDSLQGIHQGKARANGQKPRDAAQGRHRRCKLLSQIDIVQQNPRRFGHRRSRRPCRRPEQGIAVGLAAGGGGVGARERTIESSDCAPSSCATATPDPWGAAAAAGSAWQAGAQPWGRLRCVRRRQMATTAYLFVATQQTPCPPRHFREWPPAGGQIAVACSGGAGSGASLAVNVRVA